MATERANSYSVLQMKYIDKDNSWKEQLSVVGGSLSVQNRS